MVKSLFAFLIFFSFLNGAESYWNHDLVRSYVHRSELQRRWAWSFLASYLKQLKGNERILDMGCGDGKITADISKFVPQGLVIGMDPSKHMLDWAKKQYHHLEYPHLLFQEGSFLELSLSDSFDLIVSFCALQHSSDLKKGLENLVKLLKPEGKLLILVPAMDNIALNQARKIVQERPKWAIYWQNFKSRKFLSPPQYIELLSATNLHPIKVELVKKMDPFVDRQEMLEWMEGTFAPVVPLEMARDFYNEWIDEYLQLRPQAMSTEGAIYAQMNVIEIEAVPSAHL